MASIYTTTTYRMCCFSWLLRSNGRDSAGHSTLKTAAAAVVLRIGYAPDKGGKGTMRPRS